MRARCRESFAAAAAPDLFFEGAHSPKMRPGAQPGAGARLAGRACLWRCRRRATHPRDSSFSVSLASFRSAWPSAASMDVIVSASMGWCTGCPATKIEERLSEGRGPTFHVESLDKCRTAILSLRRFCLFGLPFLSAFLSTTALGWLGAAVRGARHSGEP